MEKNKREIDHFSKLDHIWWGAQTKAGQKRYFNKGQLLKRMCKLKDKKWILEIGCGDGEFTKRLIKVTNSKTKIIAIDITPAVIKRAKDNIKNSKVVFKVDDAKKINFPSAYFDLVCGVSILHHLDLEKALKEIYRVLKKEGEIFFTEPNLLNPCNFFGSKISYLRQIMEFSPDERIFTRWEIKKKLKSAGFMKVEVKNIDFLHPSTPPFLIDLVEKIGFFLEKIPLIREISGSLLIYAQK